MPHDLITLPAETDTMSLVQETLADVTPRAAALALLRFPDYLELIQKSGVATTDELCSALFEELKSICLKDR